MKPRTPDQVYKILDNAVAKAVAAGWTPTPGLTLEVSTKCCCPLGAKYIDKSYGFDDILSAFSRDYSLKQSEVRSIVHGFDQPDTVVHTDWSTVGVRLHQKWVKA